MADDDRRGDESKLSRREGVRLAVMAVLVTLVVVLAVANSDSVPVDYLFDTKRIPLVWVIVVSLVVGALLDRMYVFVRGRRRRD